MSHKKRKDDLSDWGDPNDKPSKEEKLRRAIDSWVGTLTQVIGLLLLVYSIVFDKFKNPALFPGAVGLIGLKTFAGRGRGE